MILKPTGHTDRLFDMDYSEELAILTDRVRDLGFEDIIIESEGIIEAFINQSGYLPGGVPSDNIRNVHALIRQHIDCPKTKVSALVQLVNTLGCVLAVVNLPSNKKLDEYWCRVIWPYLICNELLGRVNYDAAIRKMYDDPYFKNGINPKFN